MPNIPWWAFLIPVVVAIGVVVYQMMRDDDDDEEGEGFDGADTLVSSDAHDKDALETTTEEYRSTSARKSRMIALKQSLEDSIQTTAGVKVSTKDRLSMPWFMLVGADGSGKATLLANSGVPLPYGPPIEVDSKRRDAGRWWLFEDAVVLEAPPAAPAPTAADSTLPPGQPIVNTSAGWNTLLHMLRRERPDSPLNGIIVSISCADLVGSRRTAEELGEQAAHIREFLDRTREVLGVRLPLHIVVTKCDSMPGFRSFVETLPPERRDDIFGWANDEDVEAQFNPSWVDVGFSALKRSLAALHDEMLAAADEIPDSDALFVFVNEFAEMQEPLREFVMHLMPEEERRPSLFFRGMYFTGDTLESAKERGSAYDEAANSGGTLRLSAEIDIPNAKAHNLVFLRSLFLDKIFREAGLARPAARLRLSRDRRVVAAQAAAILIAFGGGSGLWTSIDGFKDRAGLRANAAALTRVLAGVAIDLDEVKRAPDSLADRRVHDAAVIQLVDQMREVPSGGVKSPFIPTSWLSPLPDEIRRSMMMGVESIVLPVIRQRLHERAELLLGAGGGGVTGSDVPVAADIGSLTTYVRDVRTLNANIARYNALAAADSGGVAELAALLDYLFGERPINADSASANPEFRSALRQAEGARIPVTQNMARTALARSVAMVAAVADAASRQLESRPNAQDERAVRPADDLAALRDLNALAELSDPRRGLVAAVTDSAVFGVRIARAIQDSISAHLRLAASRISGDTLASETHEQQLRTALRALFGFRFMEPSEGREIASEIRPNEHLRWDAGRLELGLAFRGEFFQSLITTAEGFPERLRERMRRALEVQLRSRVIDAAASAQRFTAATDTSRASLEMRAAASNLEAASLRLGRLAFLLDTLGASAEGKRLVVAGTRQAEKVLGRAQTVFEGHRQLTPNTARIIAWKGVSPFAYAALGVTEQIDFQTAQVQYENAVRSLHTDVSPALGYFRLPGVAETVRARRLVADWEAIAASVRRFEAGDPNSSLGALFRFLRDDMSSTDLEGCATLASSMADAERAVGASDAFVVKRRQLRAALISKCGPNGSADAVAAYRRLGGAFMSRLAGRVPFVSGAVPGAEEADSTAVREFFRQYDAFITTGDVSLRSDPRITEAASGALTFLDQLAQVRAFMSPYVDSGAVRAGPEYDVVIRRGSTAIKDNTFMEQLLQIGDRGYALAESDQTATWRSGEAVTLTQGARTSEVPAFASTRRWALVQLAVQQRDSGAVSIRFFHPDTKTELPLPVFPTAAPDIVTPRPR